jgi:glutamine amidotransferase
VTQAVTVVDYGIGNLKSVCQALDFSDGGVDLTSDPTAIAQASRLVLPGVGAFGMCMDALRSRNLVDAILEFFRSERPFLGICVGMQMMLERGEEFGEHTGLGLISGSVKAIPRPALDQVRYKVPHIGWSQLAKTGAADWSDTILADCSDREPMYFVHSYTAQPTQSGVRVADCDYFGNQLSGVIRDGNRYGCQFHPEKSGVSGLRVLRRFLAL